MSKASETVERRKHPRKQISIKSVIAGHDVSSECYTVDLSANGLLCQTNRPVAVFTKVQITLMVPRPNGNSKAGRHREDPVECEGIVVRCEKDSEKREPSYSTAIFFSDIEDDAMEKIQRYLVSHRH